MRYVALIAFLAGLAAAPALAQFDHGHRAWDALLKKHVVVEQGGRASKVRYAGFKADDAALRAYTEALAKVPEAEFRGWTKPQQMAFLINAYNAFTVVKVLQRYPDLKSIRDFGRVVGNPWKDRFFTLLGRQSTLDEVEHETLRKPGVYDEPRVHYAVNCASIGCPMLREEAFVAERLDAQLEEQARRFLSDRSRNRFSGGALEVSRIFDWFKVDWQSGYRGIGPGAAPITTREQYFARYATLLSDKPEEQKLIAEGRAEIRFLEYDWALNAHR
ncbi:MAG: DUF547 domain-containing protein [Burkholderiales bacterium]|nr:DUF547 domain-containing protein [Burkholderiales bacterium]